MIVAGKRQHTAMPRRAGRIGMFQRVDRAVYAGPLAVPYPEHAIDFRPWKHPDLLAAPHRGCREVLVQPRNEGNIVRLQKRFCAPQSIVVHAKRRAAITRDKSGGVEILQPVAFALQHRQPDQRLDSGEVDSLGVEPVFVVQPDLDQRHLICSVKSTWRVDHRAEVFCFVIKLSAGR